MGLREKKKDRRKKKIYESALKLFLEFGYEKTTMEMIAGDAELGVGTLYNYYSSKHDIFFSIIEISSEKYVGQFDEVIGNCETLADSIYRFIDIYMECFSVYGKRIWRELFGEILLRDHKLAENIDILDEDFLNKIRELLIGFRSKGVFKQDINIDVTASTLYSLLGYNLIRYVNDNEMSEKELINTLKSQVKLVIDAIIK
ncbi:MAG: TetR/AcrR family transcriptional regulator [bacterium]